MCVCVRACVRSCVRTCVRACVGVVWCGVVWCGVVWCGVVWCGVVWCGVVWCGVVWCGVVWCGVVWCGVRVYHRELSYQTQQIDKVNKCIYVLWSTSSVSPLATSSTVNRTRTQLSSHAGYSAMSARRTDNTSLHTCVTGVSSLRLFAFILHLRCKL